MLGPLSYVNHSCSPNAKWWDMGRGTMTLKVTKEGGGKEGDATHCVQVTRAISPGEEVLVCYTTGYFPPGECQCAHCGGPGPTCTCPQHTLTAKERRVRERQARADARDTRCQPQLHLVGELVETQTMLGIETHCSDDVTL